MTFGTRGDPREGGRERNNVSQSFAVGICSLAEREKEKSRMSASLPVPHHSNPRRGEGNAGDGKQANKPPENGFYLRRARGKRRRARRETGDREEEDTEGKVRVRRRREEERSEKRGGG